MGKISKSDLLDKDQEDSTRAWLDNQKGSQHFALGTFVVIKNKRYEVVDVFGDWMLIKDEDGQTFETRPYALRRYGSMNVNDTVDAPEGKLGAAAPDWGHHYGIRELWTEIQDGLWVGGTHDDDTVGEARDSKTTFGGNYLVTQDAEIGPDEFDAVVTLYAWARPVDWLVEELRWGIFDGGEAPDIETIRDAVVWAHKRWRADKKVLLRCQAGLSRSTFLTALVLIRDGMEVWDAINLIREKRSRFCLNVNGSSSGGAFTKILMETPVEFWRD